jgi:YihY family inner membrane protein
VTVAMGHLGRQTWASESSSEQGRIKRFFGFFLSAYRDDVFFMAAALSFNALLTTIPFAMLFLSVLGYILNTPGAAAESIRSILSLILPDQTGFTGAPMARTEELITTVIESRADFSRYGIPLFLVFSTRMFRTARVALDRILGESPRRRWFFGIMRDGVLVIATSILFVASAIIAIPARGSGLIQLVLANVLAVAFSTMLFYLVYSLAPSRKLHRHTALLAAFLTSFAFEAAKILYGIYLAEYATSSQLISEENAIAVLLFVGWVYYTSAIFLLGGEFAKAYEAYEAAPP